MYKYYSNPRMQLYPSRFRKVLMIMKLTSLLLIIVILNVSAATTLAQKVTLNEKNAKLVDVFNDISSQTGYDFAFTSSVVKIAKPVTIQVKNEELAIVLDKVLKSQDLDYSVDNKIVVVKEKETNTTVPTMPAAEVIVTGKVTNELGEPMAGVNVKEKGTTNGTVTDAKGAYHLTVTDSKSLIDFSYVGFETVELSAKDLPDGSQVMLKATSQNLQEVVVSKGYYDEKQIENTGDVSVVKGSDIEKQPVTDPILALDGRVPGMYISQSIGAPGSNSTVRIRGQNSIGAGNNPLYVVDGVPYNSMSPTDFNLGESSVLGSLAGDGSGLSPFNSLDPFDIENIEVLKDADATAIYGSRGANGVVLITTKKGKAGKTEVTLNAFTGFENVAHYLDLMNSEQYMSMIHQSVINSGYQSLVTPAFASYFPDLLGIWDTTRNTNWQKVLIGNTAKFNNLSTTVSGGNANTQFRIGGGYSNQGTVYPGSFSDQKDMFNASLSHTSADQRFHLELDMNYVYENNNLPQSDFTLAAATLPPVAPMLYNQDGTLNWAIYGGGQTWQNPLASEYSNARSLVDNLVSNIMLSYQIIPGLDVKISGGFTHIQNNEDHEQLSAFNPPPGNEQPDNRLIFYGTSDTRTWILEPQVDYSKTFGKAKFDFLVGATFQQNLTNSNGFEAFGFSSDYLVSDPEAASTVELNGYNNSRYNYDAGYARFGFNWDNKYILNLTGNRDGSSRFGPGKQFGNFYAVGGAWVFSKEKAIENALPWLGLGKLRISYGSTGNDQIGDYQYLSSYSISGNTYQGLSTLYPTGLSNVDYAWEVVKKFESGIELGFLDDRINLEVSYYFNRTENSLIGYSLPYLTGYTTVTANLPAKIQNDGIELSLNSTNIKTQNFSWSTNFNFSEPKNKLLAYPNLANTVYANFYKIGDALSVKKLYHYVGINPKDGVAEFSTLNGGVTENPTQQDMVWTKPITQNWFGGFENSFSYKHFSLSFLFQFVNQTGFNYLHNEAIVGTFPGFFKTNQPIQALSSWKKPGDNALYGVYSMSSQADPNGDLKNSDWALVNTSFIRLKNASLSYNLPKNWSKKLGMENCRVYVQGENLLTFTHDYLGYDPETGPTGLPPLKTITTGIQVAF